MNFRLTGILFLVALVLVAGLILVNFFEGDPQAEANVGTLGEPLAKLGIKKEKLTTLELSRTQPGEEKLLFTKTDGKWQLQQPVQAKVESSVIQNIVDEVFSASPIKFNGPTENLTVHELDKPTFKVTIGDSENHSITVNIGKAIPAIGSATLFITTADRPKVAVAVKQSSLASLFRELNKTGSAWQLTKWLTDYRQKKLFGGSSPSAIQDLTGIKISYTGKTLELQKKSATWTFAQPTGFGEADEVGESAARALNQPFSGVTPLAGYLLGLQVASNEDIIEKPAELSVYGLKASDPNLMPVELTYKDGSKETVHFGRFVEEKGQPVTPTKVYGQIPGDSAVFILTMDRVVGLQQTAIMPNELRNRDIFATPRKIQMDAIDLTIAGNTVKLRKMPTGNGRETTWISYDQGGQPFAAKNSEVEAMLNALTKPRAALEVLAGDQNAPFTDAEKKANVKIWLDGLPKIEKVSPDQIPAEPKLTATPIELIFGKKDGNVVYLRKTEGKQVTDFKVPEALYQAFAKKRLDLMDPKLKSFGTQLVTSMMFYRGKELYELTKTGENWSFATPANLKGLPADSNKCMALIGLLSGLYSDRIVAENPTPEQLKSYGLDPNGSRMKIYLTMPEDTNKSLTYDLGFETDDKTQVYARQTGSNFVVTVRKDIFDRLSTEDLREASLHKFDLNSVTKLAFRGWKGVNSPDPVEVVLERKENGWNTISPPSPKDLVADTGKVVALLKLLQGVVVEKVIGEAKPEYNLDHTKSLDALEIVLDSGSKAPAITFKLGGKLEGGKAYASSTKYAEGKVVVQIDATPLRQALAKPTDLAK